MDFGESFGVFSRRHRQCLKMPQTVKPSSFSAKNCHPDKFNAIITCTVLVEAGPHQACNTEQQNNTAPPH